MYNKEKTRILSISKNKRRSMFEFPKEQKMFGIIIEFLYKLGFKVEDHIPIKISDFGKKWDRETSSPSNEEEDIKTFNERIENYICDDYSMEIIFFSKTIVLILNYKEDKQEEIGEALKGLIEEEL